MSPSRCSAGFVAVAKRRICDGAFSQTLRLVEPVEQQSGTSHRVVGHEHTVPRPLTLEESLALLEPGQRLAGLAELREDPGGGGDHGAKAGVNAPLPERRDTVLDH